VYNEFNIQNVLGVSLWCRHKEDILAVTIKDIAKKVGKSVTTVSRALSGYDDVSQETRRLVLQAANELGYVPNITARQLQKRRTDTIGLILPPVNPRFSDPFFSEFLSGIVGQSSQNDFDLLVSTHSSSENEIEVYLKFIRSRKVDGFIIIRTQRKDPRIDLLREHDFPFVAFGRVEENNDFPLIDEDSEFGMEQIVNHLIKLGHSRLAFIAEPTHLTKSFLRLRGFCKTLEMHGLPIDHELVIEGGFRQQSGRLMGERLLTMSNPPTAIVACNDLLALGAMSTARKLGLEIGRDISITGFDDIVLAENAHPPLTTIHQSAEKIGALINQMLVRVINGENHVENQLILKPKLVVRQSTGPVNV
jgi:DNA-binding LacI/PurR family transcriptional regulator